jgi:osmoprotectant transport system ATP-binding protein
LIEPTSGEILIDGVDVLALDPVQLRRGIGFVMQSGGLFPHRRVADNVATVPRLLGWPASKVGARVEELLQLVGLDPATYLRRFPHELSGGERQRVGVARALGADPPILLMDEPFGAVDPIARKRLQAEFKELQDRLNKTVVFVTHDIEEALFLGHRIAIMQHGANLEQFDTPEAILAKPATPFVAEFVGADRDLQRLAVTELSLEDVEPALTAPSSATVGDLLALAATGSGPIVMVANDGFPIGRVELAGADSDVSVLDLVVPFSGVLPIGTTLKTALATMLQDDDPFVAVTSAGRYVGVLTLEGLHRAMRRVS